MLHLRGLGQSVPQGDVRYSTNVVTSLAQCQSKGGDLYAENRFCCIEIDPTNGKHVSGTGKWMCAPTTFGAAAPTPGLFPWSTPSVPPTPQTNQAGMFGGVSPEILALGVGALVLVLLFKRK